MQNAILKMVFQFLTFLYFLGFGVAFFATAFKFMKIASDIVLGFPTSVGSKVFFSVLLLVVLLFVLSTAFFVNLYSSYEPFHAFLNFCWG